MSCSDVICPILIHSRNEDLGYFGNNPYMKIDSNHFRIPSFQCLHMCGECTAYVLHVPCIHAFSGMYRHGYIGGGGTLKCDSSNLDKI